MTKQELEQLTKQVEELDYEQQLLLIERLITLIENYERTIAEDENEWTEEELAELLKPKKPMTGKEMVAAGLYGGWEDIGIEDGAEWVNQQKAIRKAKSPWRWPTNARGF
jgi:hypothetical protein